MTRVRLTAGQVLVEAGAPLDQVFFLESGLAILIAYYDGGDPSCLAMVGSEGGVGLLELVTESRTAIATVITVIPGVAFRVASDQVSYAMQTVPSLGDAGRQFGRALMSQVMETSARNIRDTLARRCARWLAMAHRRLDLDHVPVTHEAMAIMLGVRRPCVTMAIASLQERGWIKTGYGRIKVLVPRELCSFGGLPAVPEPKQ